MEFTQIDGRLLYILQKANEKEFNKLEDFAQLLNVSTRTIRNYIKQLNSIIKKDVAQLVSIRELGYKLEVYNQEKFKRFINYNLSKASNMQLLNSPNERLKYIIKKLIHSRTAIKIDELAEEMNIGRTTLINDMKKVSKTLKAYDLTIKGKQNGGTQLNGNELSIRLVILDFLCKGLNECASEYYLLDKTKYDEIKKYLTDLFYDNNFIATDKTLEETIMCISMLLVRVKDKHYIETLDKKHKDVMNTEEYNLARKIKAKIEKTFTIEINDNETVFLTLPLLVRRAPISNNDSDGIRVDSSIKRLVLDILEEVNSSMEFNIKYDKELIGSLEYHLNFSLNRLMFNMKVKNHLLNDIKKCYPLPYEMAKIAAKVIEKNYNVKVSEDEIGYIALHFGSYIERSNQKFITIEKVALVCGTGLGTAKLLYIKLKKLLGEDKIINTFSDLDLSKDLLDQYDIVFTTVNININTETPIIKVNALFNENELQKQIEKRYYYKKYNLETFESDLSLFNIKIEEDLFFILEKDNFIDNLAFMLDSLEDMKRVDKGFKERIIEREYKSPTSLGNYIALPHAVNYAGDKISISIGILKDAMIWGESEVKVIILLMIPNEENIEHDILIKTYEELLKLCQNKRFVEGMFKVESYIEFRKLLQNEVIK